MMNYSNKLLLILLLAGIALACGPNDRAAVEVPAHILEMDEVSVYTDEDINNYKELGGSADSPYFNSGVMLLNIELWRKEKWTEKAIQYIQENL